jgi:rare lipoprotein A
MKNKKIVNASFYGNGEKLSKYTASGEVFNRHAFTAAHRTLPFGTIVHVTNIKNNKTVVVRINDRGPFHKSREIDLSYGAAKVISLTNSGVSKVEIKY